mmetsp:Transcript_14216/g.40799  ORF Transcript_14216/g.40799 Transcript_14216/m.40799 type:complete len:216 (-) Transcript_14216:235-882(-)
MHLPIKLSRLTVGVKLKAKRVQVANIKVVEHFLEGFISLGIIVVTKVVTGGTKDAHQLFIGRHIVEYVVVQSTVVEGHGNLCAWLAEGLLGVLLLLLLLHLFHHELLHLLLVGARYVPAAERVERRISHLGHHLHLPHLLLLLLLLRIAVHSWHHRALAMRALLKLLRKSHKRRRVTLRREAALLLLNLHRVGLGEAIGAGTCAATVATSVPFCI